MSSAAQPRVSYRGRLAPSPTGYLHAGHALTFWRAQERAREHRGALILRIEDLDRTRARAEFETAILEDLEWFGLRWDEGPYRQSERSAHYLGAWEKLRATGLIYRCDCSRRDLQQAAVAPHAEEEEPVYPGTCRPARLTMPNEQRPGGCNWRFCVPEGEVLKFHDRCAGMQRAIAGVDFGDFVVWRKDDVPAYQLAVVVDDAAMGITEVVRGADLLLSTFRQLLLYRALALPVPEFCHTSLVLDSLGKRLAKRHDALSLRQLRAAGITPAQLRRRFHSAVAPPLSS
jgi:glutamyl-tRNA synthetase